MTSVRIAGSRDGCHPRPKKQRSQRGFWVAAAIPPFGLRPHSGIAATVALRSGSGGRYTFRFKFLVGLNVKRALLKSLISWKSKSERKPVLIDGARQIGKTHLLRNLLGKEFANILRLDFLENPEFKEAFDDSLTPHDILMNIELMTGQKFHPETDLLILDEIGECERAATSLKYFAEKTPTYFVAASGSNVGLLNTFPVGKVEHHNLRPMTFQEFLYASEESALIKAFEAQADSAVAHARLLDMLTDYSAR